MFKFLKENRIKFVYFPLVIYWLLLIVATSLPGKSMPKVGVSDKVEHLTAYFGLTFLLSLFAMFQEKLKFLKEKPAFFTILIVASYAAIDELHQLFIPGRSCDILDWSADMIGAVSAFLLIKILMKWFDYKPIST